jgi:hypothetical protein
MPLTFAHPAAVLPFLRGPFVPSALVAGALAPDLSYFLRALPIPVSAQSWWEPFLNATTTHSWPGAVTIAMPLALALYLALASCERPVRWALPATSDPAATGKTLRPLWAAWVVASLALGVLTHVAWDSLTHSDGWVVENVAALRADIIGSLTGARLLQHLSTVLGLTAILVFALRRRNAWLVSTDARRRARFLRAVAVALGTAVTVMVAVVSVKYEAGTGIEHLLSSAAIGAGLGAAVAAAGLALIWWVVRPDRPGADVGGAR